MSHKVLRISKTFGIEGKKLLKPDDDYQALKDFTHAYEGTTSPIEQMRLEYQKLLKDYPDLLERINALPGRVFSGKPHPSSSTQAVFLCFAMPAPPAPAEKPGDPVAPGFSPAGAALSGSADESPQWSEDSSDTRWYLFDVNTGKIAEDPAEIVKLIRCTPETARKHDIPESTLSEIRARVEKHIKNTYLKQVQAPIGVKPTLKAWMELS